jgi:hypothetical protein
LILRDCQLHTDTLYGLKVLGDGNGGAIVLYEDTLGGNIYVQRIDAEGKNLWGQKGVLLGNSHSKFYSFSDLYITSDGSGGTIVAWPDYSSPMRPGSHIARLDAGGKFLWQRDYESFSKLISDGSGGVIIAFNNSISIPGSDEDDLKLVRVDSQGDSSWGFQGVTIKRQRYQDNTLQLTNDGNGGALLVWEEYNEMNTFEIMVQRIDSAGGLSWGEDGLLLYMTTEEVTVEDAKITGDDSGGAIVSWHQLPVGIIEAGSPESMLNDIFVQKINAGGNIVWQPEGIPLEITRSGGEPRPSGSLLVGDGAGGAIICWRDLREETNNYLNIYAQRINSNGNILWPAGGVNLSLSGMNPGCLMVGASGGTAIASYASKGYSTKGLHVQKLNADGITAWQENGVVITDNYYTTQCLSPDGTGGAIVGWGIGKGLFTKEKAYLQRVNAAGQLMWGLTGLRLNK